MPAGAWLSHYRSFTEKDVLIQKCQTLAKRLAKTKKKCTEIVDALYSRREEDMKEVEEQLETYVKENGAKFRQWYGFEYEDEDEREAEEQPYEEQYSTSLQPMTER